MTSPDLTARNIEKIAELFPNVLTETLSENGEPKAAIDFDLLRQELSDHVVEGPTERYQLNWPGKRQAAFAANAPIAKTLRPVREESVNFDETKNLFIEGDNLEVLKLLQESYLGKIKLIYIDPPYNTGNDFVYEDDFSETTEEYLQRSGQVDEEGGKLVANTESNGRFHSDWLSMMYPRLKLARNLLKDNGIILISIDDAELSNLFSIASEIFGINNFVGTMIWAAGRKNDSKYISQSHEYIICFSRSLSILKESNPEWKAKKEGLDQIYIQLEKIRSIHSNDWNAATKSMKNWYKSLDDSNPAKRHKHYSHIDENGLYHPDNLAWPDGEGPKYDILHPKTHKPTKKPAKGWRLIKETMQEAIKEGLIHFGEDETTVPKFKRYLHNTEFETPYSVFYKDGRGASKRLSSLMGGKVFDFPKDESIIQYLINVITEPSDIILDFFAGSSTTAHSVMLQNAADQGSRSFIMVQLDEEPDAKSEAAAHGYKTIAEISRERIRRAASNIIDGLSGNYRSSMDIGFRSLKLDTSNREDILRPAEGLTQLDLADHESTFKPDRSNEDLLFQVLLEWGLELSLPIKVETVGSKVVHVVAEGALAACFDREVSQEVIDFIVDLKPERAVFREDGFPSDDARINVEQVFKQVERESGVAIDVKVI